MFLFQIGTIKTQDANKMRIELGPFLFQIGTIKTSWIETFPAQS